MELYSLTNTRVYSFPLNIVPDVCTSRGTVCVVLVTIFSGQGGGDRYRIRPTWLCKERSFFLSELVPVLYEVVPKFQDFAKTRKRDEKSPDTMTQGLLDGPSLVVEWGMRGDVWRGTRGVKTLKETGVEVP